MKEHLQSVIDQANDHVNLLESQYLMGLFDWQEKSQHRAEHCKCPSCKKEAGSAQVAVCRESERLYTKGELQEL